MIIKVENIHKSFNTVNKVTLDVLKDVSLTTEKNKISVIVGASGAGKSTLLHLVGGLDKPTSGNIIINDINLFKLSDDRRAKFLNKNIGFVFQFHHLLPEFTSAENIAIPQMIKGISYKEAIKHSNELLELIGLTERANHKPAELSGGEQQRVAVARALANDPPLILADEPTGNLDTVNAEILNNLFVKLRDEYGKSLLIVTHNKDLMKLADVVFEMKDGKIVN